MRHYGFLLPFSALTYYPALEYMATDLDVSLQLMNLTITVYLVVQGVVPAVLGVLADQIGRRPVYLLVLMVYVAACIELALQRSYAALVVLRMRWKFRSVCHNNYSASVPEFLRHVEQSPRRNHLGTIALGIMVVADFAPPHSRGSICTSHAIRVRFYETFLQDHD